MSDLYLSALAHVHGEPRPIASLAEPGAEELTDPLHGLASYRQSELPIWRLAALAGERTLELADGAPDLLLYISENDEDIADSLARLADRLGLPTVEYLALAGHGCANLGPALRIAGDALASGRHRRVLLISADRAPAGGRLMKSGLSVFSDGAAAGVLTRSPPDRRSATFRIDAVGLRTSVRAGSRSAPGLLDIVELATDAVTDILAETGRSPEDFDAVVFANYRLQSQGFLATAMGFGQDRLLLGDVAGLAHSFSADLLITLEQLAADGRTRPGHRLLVSATGPHAWSILAVEQVGLQPREEGPHR
ncbi:3-oxoacyl-[acyl-carrier-protein] synthase III C-terminal domain-containing protein [Kitasatospora sp. NPDC057015]|uniref:3-oxoacyl-[acyl-carrier-protein] synthase III C-terminal domain-containing protein n=1 Tax=Kitasatospora sp. NPDC057015 TaxID=3346001 RepID=UPI0036321C23